MLDVRDLHVYYGKSHVVHGVTLSVDQGEVVGLLGRNGAGKTSTLRGVMGLTKPAQGTVIVGETDVSARPPHQRAGAGLGYVPQGRLLFDRMTIEENLRTVARRDGELWDRTLELFPVVAERLRQPAGTLSGGEQQMVAIARALLTDPKVLLLDEPMTGLMPAVVDRLRTALLALRDAGVGLLLVEEQVPLALEICDRILLIDVGHIVHEGTPSELQGTDVLMRHLGVTIAR